METLVREVDILITNGIPADGPYNGRGSFEQVRLGWNCGTGEGQNVRIRTTFRISGLTNVSRSLIDIVFIRRTLVWWRLFWSGLK